MGFLRRLLGGDRDAASDSADDAPDSGDEASDEGPDSADHADADEAPVSPDEAARRQVEYERYAWQPDSQLRRDGDWILMVRWKVQSPEGNDVKLKPGSRLTWVGPGTMSPGAVRFRTEKGVLVDLPAGRATPDGWPEDLQRPRSPTAGSEES